MDICIFGAGSVGGILAGRLKKADKHKISIVARGPHLAAIRESGLEVVLPEQTFRVQFDAADDNVENLPKQDIVFVTLKAHTVPAIAHDLLKLLKPEGFCVFIANGIPWWWNLKLEGGSGEPMRVDPDRLLERAIGAERTIGGVVYSGNEVVAPGRVFHIGNNQWIFGELDNSVTERVTQVAEILRDAGLNGEVSTDIRGAVWKKMQRNCVFNTLAAITRLVVTEYENVPPLFELAERLTAEMDAVAAATGWKLPASDPKSVINTGGIVGGREGLRLPPGMVIRGSMHQDVVSGRSMEVEPLVGHVQQLAREHSVPTPALDVIYALLLGIDRGLALDR